MAQYTITQASARLAVASQGLLPRVEIGMLKYAATRWGTAINDVEKTYIRRLAGNPTGEANAALPLVLAVSNVADAANDPTDTELTTTITAIWSFLVGA